MAAAKNRRNLSQKKPAGVEEHEDAFDVFDVTKPKNSNFGDDEYSFGFENDDYEFEDDETKAKKKGESLNSHFRVCFREIFPTHGHL